MKGPVRRSHRWLMLLVGGQVLFWSLSGLHMVWFDIYYIQGEHFFTWAQRDDERRHRLADRQYH